MATRTICSLFGAAWLAAGTVAADPGTAPPAPPPLRPLHNTGPAVREPAPLVPVVKPPAPEMPTLTVPAGGQTLYYQKDAKTGVETAAFQQPGTGPSMVPQLPPGAINTKPPDVADIGLHSDQDLYRLIREEAEQVNVPARDNIFKNLPADYVDLSKVPYAPRAFQPAVERVEPNYVCYNRLYFEDKNAERYGWELGVLQPVWSTLKFYKDFIMFPYNFGTRVCQRYETDAGYCLPGDPVPYIIYPVELSATGGLLQAGTTVGLIGIFNGF
jgi:hypothetical protein